MSLFGSFEAEREVYSDPFYAVYSAHKPGDAETAYAIKVFRLPAAGLDLALGIETRPREEVRQEILDRIKIQQKGATASAFITPILETGSDDRGVWYATRFYARSINKMMSGKVALPRAALEHLIRSVAQGALDLKRTCGRSHGDIRPTNIQVSKEELTEAQVALSDPLPGSEADAERYELDDLHSIGGILLQLVLKRLLSKDDLILAFPVTPSPAWELVFGTSAAGWLALCNQLLDPDLSLEQLNLETLLAKIDALTPKRGISPILTIAVVSLLVVIAAGVIWWLLPRTYAVSVSSDPPGAVIRVDQTKDYGTAPLQLKLSRGNHVLEARHELLGLADQVTNLLVQPGRETQVHFQFPYGSVAIKSDPPRAIITRDDKVLGSTPNDSSFTIAMARPGPVKYQLKLDNYESAELNGVISQSQTLRLAATLRPIEKPQPINTTQTTTEKVPEPPPIIDAAVELKAVPGPAVIYDSDGRDRGRAAADTPLTLRVPLGDHSFTARTEGLDDLTATLNVSAAGPNQHTFTFDYGTVEWAAEPATAKISRGEDTRPAPATFFQKPAIAGSYIISAPGYRSITNAVTVETGERKTMSTKLDRQLVAVEVASDPPGVQLITENGSLLVASETNKLVFLLPWGPTNLVARHPILGTVTNHAELKPGSGVSKLQFKFNYGALLLTNLPPNAVLYDGEARLGSAADGWVYQKPGTHLYSLRGKGNPEIVETNIQPGPNFLLFAKPQKTWNNELGMWFAWVPFLPGGGEWPGQAESGGWVGISEVTQGQYKRMGSSNPSVYRDGGDNYPVENVSLEQAISFCRWLSTSDPAPHANWRYTLPTEEQFLAFAADADQIPRVTNEGRISNTMDDTLPFQRVPRIPAAANLNNARTHPEMVGSTKQPNKYGLYDVVGNVSEWTWRAGSREPVYAGGGYLNFTPKTVGTKAREHALEKGPSIGFRVVLIPQQ